MEEKEVSHEKDNHVNYSTATESMTINDKVKILEDLGKPELIELFKEWKPRPSKRKKQAPLDQRVNITVSDSEKVQLDNEIKKLKESDPSISASQLIRSRAISKIDIHGWKELAIKELEAISNIENKRKDLMKRRLSIISEIDDAEDREDVAVLDKELSEINRKLEKLKTKSVKRNNRLTGRMSLAESETIKWRAERLCLTASDYLRFMIFGLEPAGNGDAHMTLDTRKRFYISIIDVSDNGWGEPDTLFNCTQCANYLDEIEKLRDRIKQLESFV